MEIGMGGTVVKKIMQGAQITSVILTDGRRSSNPFQWPEERMASIRKQEAMNAALILGVKEVIFFDLPKLTDNLHYNLAKERLGTLIKQLQPDEVYFPHEYLDRHPTHQLAGKITRECLENSLSLAAMWAYEVWGLFPTWDRTEYIDDQVGKKIQAIEAHKSQVASIPYGEAVIGLNRWRAVFENPQQATTKGIFAEVFLLMSPTF